jgi:thioredoxin-related protein
MIRPLLRRSAALIPVLLSLASLPTPAADVPWVTDLEAARKTAAEAKKDLLIEFTGSDWCAWCKRLDQDVFSDPGFRKQIGEKFVLVQIDFPQAREQSEPEKRQNQKLQTDFGVDGFPTVFLADAEGLPYARTGYLEGGPEEYLKHLLRIAGARADRDKGLQAAAKAEGVERAFHLKAALDALPNELDSLPVYADLRKQIEELDKDDQLGFRKAAKDQALTDALGAELRQLVDDGKRGEIVGRVDAFLAANSLSVPARQSALMLKLLSYGQNDVEAASKVLDEVIAVDPQSDAAKQAQLVKTRLTTVRPKPRKPSSKPPPTPAM